MYLLTFLRMDSPQVVRARQLYSILVGSLKGKPLRILKGVSNRNGFEAWRQLLAQYQTSNTSPIYFSAFCPDEFSRLSTRLRRFLEQIQGFERLKAEYKEIQWC